MNRVTVPLSRALIWILLSTVVVSGSATLAWLYSQRLEARRINDPNYTITEILQRPSSPEGLPSNYLAEILGLSKDQPLNSYRLHPANAAKKLEIHPVIEWAQVGKLLPDTVVIDYKLREPLAIVVDWSNTAVDKHGKLFPLEPFYEKEGLPELVLGLSKDHSPAWGKRVEGEEWGLAKEILAACEDCPRRIDLSNAFAPSFGKREIIVVTEERILRLNSRYWRENLRHYEALKPELQKITDSTDSPIDLRIPKVAFVKSPTP